MRKVFALITFAFLGVLFLILAGVVSLVVRLTGRRRRMRRIFKGFGLAYVVIAPLFLLVLFPFLMAHQVSGFGTRVWDLESTETPESYGCDFEEVSFRSRDGVPLTGWWMPGQKELPVLVITHGLFRDRKEVTERGCRLNREGHAVLVFDLRRHGASGGETTSLGYLERLDVQGAYDFVRADTSAGVILMGVSMGATACILALPDTGPDVVGILADSPFLSLEETIDRHVKLLLGLPAFPFSDVFRWELTRIAGFEGESLDCRRGLAAAAPSPVLLIYGEKDQRMPAETARAVYEAVPHPEKELVFFPEAGHGAAWRTDPERYLALVLKFASNRASTGTPAK